MSHTRWKVCAGLLATIAMLFPACKAADDEAIAHAIDSAHVLGADYKFSAHKDATGLLTVSTYLNSSSKDYGKDCKVDAVLIAKAAAEADPKILKFAVRFYDYAQTSYLEVIVKKTDIAAFGSGQVTKDELLSTLDLTKVNVAAPKTAAATQSTEPAVRSLTLSPTDKYNTFRRNGIAFYYPKSWSEKPYETKWGDFAKLDSSGKRWACVMLKRQSDEPSPQQAINDQNKWYWSSHKHKVIGLKTQIIGYERNIEAHIVYIRNLESSEPNRSEKHVYFGYKNRIYSIVLQVADEDYQQIGSEFDAMLNTMCYSD
jgi:hypothetical protein